MNKETKDGVNSFTYHTHLHVIRKKKGSSAKKFMWVGLVFFVIEWERLGFLMLVTAKHTEKEFGCGVGWLDLANVCAMFWLKHTFYGKSHNNYILWCSRGNRCSPLLACMHTCSMYAHNIITLSINMVLSRWLLVGKRK